MAVETLSYQGINRAFSDYSGARFCEELIDLRPTSEGLVPVKDFNAKKSNVAWRRIFVHHSTGGDHYFVVKKNSGSVSVHLLGGSDGMTEQAAKFSVPSSSDAMAERIIDGISFAAAGNIVLFSVCDKTDSKYYNYAYTWKMNSQGNMAYVDTEADIPPITFSLGDGTDSVEVVKSISPLNESSGKEDVNSIVETALNEIQEDNPNLCLGTFIYAVAYKTTDGSTFWTNKWGVYDPISKINATTTDPPYHVTSSDFSGELGDQYSDFFSEHHNSGYLLSYQFVQTKAIRVRGTNVSLSLTMSSGAWNKEESIIQSVEVYASKPKMYLDASYAYDGFKYVFGNSIFFSLVLPQIERDVLDLDSQLLYHQASIPLDSLSGTTQEVNFTFGGNQQVTSETLDVDAGAVTRYGKIISYNARFHYFDSVSTIQIGMPSFLWNTFPGSAVTAYVFAVYADNEHQEKVYLGTTSTFTGSAYVVIAPSVNIKEVWVYGSADSSHKQIHKYRMRASSSYNYSVCTEGAYSSPLISGTDSELDSLISGGVKGITSEEQAAINVTEQYNPFVFRVEHSYLAPGNVLDVQPQMAGIVDSSYGRDPLNVFTVRGLYALTQGSANVLYGAFLPLSDLVLSGPSVPTEQGIFFLADGALWLVRGRTATLVSDALHLGPHKFLRACTGYKKISGQDSSYSPSPVVSDPIYDVSGDLSQVTFETFVRGDATNSISKGTLAFNRFRLELFVSNPSFDYSYVLSLKYRQWYKLSRRIWQDQPGATIVSTNGTTAGYITVLDLSVENDSVKTVHYQTRPFSMGYMYSHLHRIVAMVRAELENSSQNLTAALYGSDNLQDWNLLAYAYRSGTTTTEDNVTTNTPLKLSQLRTTSSSRSWRYYTVTVGGIINTAKDIDLGPVVVDYEPVIRRIG